jgi:hypothetical protein
MRWTIGFTQKNAVNLSSVVCSRAYTWYAYYEAWLLHIEEIVRMDFQIGEALGRIE